MQEQMVNISREMNILKRNQKEMLEIKNIVKEMTNVFGGLISTLDVAEERISELENISIETSKTKGQRKKETQKNRTEYQRGVGQLQSFNICRMRIPERNKGQETEEIYEI